MKSFFCFTILFAVPLVAGLSSCASTRLGQFNAFAQAGVTYVNASQTVIQDAGDAAVNTDSALLIKVRPDLTEAERRTRVTASNTLLKQRLQVLQLISAHGKLLQDYFRALASLSDSKAGNSVGTSAQDAYNALAKISPELKNAKMGTTSVSNFIPMIINPVVAAFKVHALNDELKARSGAIASELALQEAAFSAIKSELRTDLLEQQNFSESDSINEFAASATLSSDWVSRRLAVLSTPPVLASAEAASKAAASLRNSFIALVENRVDSAGFTSLLSDISNMVSIAQTLEAGVKK